MASVVLDHARKERLQHLQGDNREDDDDSSIQFFIISALYQPPESQLQR